MDNALADYEGWSAHVMPGGLMLIHDVFPDPKDGGRPPFEIYKMALESGLFDEVDAVRSLRVLRQFIVTADWRPGAALDGERLKAQLAPKPQQLALL